MSKIYIRIICSAMGMLLVAVMSHAGGVAPGEMPPLEPMTREKVSVTPKQTSAAVNKARRAVTPAVKEIAINAARPKAASTASNDGWLLGSREGECAPLTSVNQKVKNIGTFKTPQEFAHQMQQRGYQTFVLDIGDVRDQIMRVKVPDLKLDLLFVRPGMCR